MKTREKRCELEIELEKQMAFEGKKKTLGFEYQTHP